jgi:hypothetical protein
MAAGLGWALRRLGRLCDDGEEAMAPEERCSDCSREYWPTVASLG